MVSLYLLLCLLLSAQASNTSNASNASIASNASDSSNQSNVVVIVANTDAPTESPTEAPTESPTESPTEAPTESPTVGMEEEEACPVVPGMVHLGNQTATCCGAAKTLIAAGAMASPSTAAIVSSCFAPEALGGCKEDGKTPTDQAVQTASVMLCCHSGNTATCGEEAIVGANAVTEGGAMNGLVVGGFDTDADNIPDLCAQVPCDGGGGEEEPVVVELTTTPVPEPEPEEGPPACVASCINACSERLDRCDCVKDCETTTCDAETKAMIQVFVDGGCTPGMENVAAVEVAVEATFSAPLDISQQEQVTEVFCDKIKEQVGDDNKEVECSIKEKVGRRRLQAAVSYTLTATIIVPESEATAFEESVVNNDSFKTGLQTTLTTNEEIKAINGGTAPSVAEIVVTKTVATTTQKPSVTTTEDTLEFSSATALSCAIVMLVPLMV